MEEHVNKTMTNRYFQWIMGERQGEVVVFDGVEEEDGIVFINFKDGSRINDEFVGEINAKALDGKMMAEVESPTNIWTFDEKMVGEEKEKWEENGAGERVCVQPAVAGRKVTKLIPPRKTTSKFGNLKQPNYTQTSTGGNQSTPEPEETKSSLSNSDPVFIMMNKSKKIDSEVNMTLTISLPSQSLFDVVSESFEDGNGKGLDYIIDSIDISEIKKSLRDGIDSMYNDKEAETVEEKTPINSLGEPQAVDEPIISEPKLDDSNRILG